MNKKIPTCRLRSVQVGQNLSYNEHEDSGLDVEVDVLEPLLDIEAGTGLLDPGEVAMADNLGIGIVEG